MIGLFVLYVIGRRQRQWMPSRPPLSPADEQDFDNTQRLLMNILESFYIDLVKNIRKAARPSGGVDSLDPRSWIGGASGSTTMVMAFVKSCVLFVWSCDLSYVDEYHTYPYGRDRRYFSARPAASSSRVAPHHLQM